MQTKNQQAVHDFFFNNDPVNAANPPTSPPSKAITKKSNDLLGSVKMRATFSTNGVAADESISHAFANHKMAIPKKPARKLAFERTATPAARAANAMLHQGRNNSNKKASMITVII